MKNLKLVIFALMAIPFISCSNDALKVESKKINGPLGEFFEVVEKDYQVNGKELSVEFKRIAEGGPKDASWSTHPTFTAELFDKSGNLISSESTDVVFTKEQLETVFALGVGETSSITFKFDDKTRGAAKIKISSKWDLEEDTEESSDSYVSEENETTAVSSSADVDAMLNNLESMLNRLAKMDDLSDEYDDLEDQIMNLMDKIEDLDMSSAQESRYDKLDARFDRL